MRAREIGKASRRVSVCVSERERVSESVCVSERECVRERKNVCKRKRERV